jgi:hypothetical protein
VRKSLHSLSFDHLWRAAGRPIAKIVQPVANWTLPSGVTYNARQDNFVNPMRALVQVPWAEQPALSVRFVPLRGHSDLAMTLAGVTQINMTDIAVQWSAEVEAALRVAWGIGIGSKVYSVHRLETQPFGAALPISIKLILSERNVG